MKNILPDHPLTALMQSSGCVIRIMIGILLGLGCYNLATTAWEDHVLIRGTVQQFQAFTPLLKQLAQVTVDPTTHNLQFVTAAPTPTNTSTTIPPKGK